jgi:hypothetical protein
MEQAIKITNWSLTPSLSRFVHFVWDADHSRLRGLAYGHPVLGTTEVITSRVVKAWTDEMGNRFVRTHSGSVYQLGRIDPVYRRWLREVVPGWDHKHPVPAA